MRVIDFVSTGSENMVYVIRNMQTSEIYWRGTRKEFIWELSSFFMFYSTVVYTFDTECPGTIILYV